VPKFFVFKIDEIDPKITEALIEAYAEEYGGIIYLGSPYVIAEPKDGVDKILEESLKINETDYEIVNGDYSFDEVINCILDRAIDTKTFEINFYDLLKKIESRCEK